MLLLQKKRLLCAAILWCSGWLALSPAAAQSPLSNRRVVRLQQPLSLLIRDSLTILPYSVEIIDNQYFIALDTGFFEVVNTDIRARPKLLERGSQGLTVRYQTLPFNLQKRFYRLDSTQINPLAPQMPIEFDYASAKPTNAPIFDKGLTYNGQYTQGFSVGNAQNLVVNQNFNLNLGGKIGDLEILAALTDNNLPIQAEGNTQQLREFDRIYIQLQKGSNKLLAGDYELLKPEDSYFLNYFKKVQGAQFSSAQRFKKLNAKKPPILATQKAAIGLSKGKFARQILQVQEGNQGPYRLLGTENGAFFIVLSGSEKVFFDGAVLVRGEENDYVIDYNRGDIVFTPKRLVTKDARIVVEFEYADQTYLRTMVAADWGLKGEKWALNAHFYNEADAKNASGTQALDSLDRAVLRRAGNNPDLAAPLSIRPISDGFRSDRIQYRLADTVVNGQFYDNILIYDINPTTALFTASFTPVGQGKGHYVQAATAANGRVYRWVAPDVNGQPQGNFEPIRRLIPPNSQQLVVLNGRFDGLKNTTLKVETAFSRHDKNLFSALDDSANIGLALTATLNHQLFWGQKKQWQLESSVKMEQTTAHFRPINPYRNAEFTRDWNVPTRTAPTESVATVGNLSNTQGTVAEQFYILGGTLRHAKGFSMAYNRATYRRDTLYFGENQWFKGQFQRKKWSLEAEVAQLKTQGVVERSVFLRPRVQWQYALTPQLKIGASGEQENNQRTDAQTDTLLRQSFSFSSWRAFAEYKKENGRSIRADFLQRYDYQAFNKSLQPLSNLDEWRLTGFLTQKINSQLTWNLTYRQLRVADTARTTLRAQETYLGRLEYNASAFKRAIVFNTLYEIGSGQEQKIEYQYIRVNKGEGQYIWNNRNNDTIPQLDEFEVAPFPDQADYVRVTLYTNDFIRTNNVALSQSLRLDPKALWYQKKGIKRYLSRLSTNSTLQVSRRVKNEAAINQWNPLDLAIPDRALVALNLAVRQSLFINRAQTRWEAELGQIWQRSRLVVVTGYEERAQETYFCRTRLNIGTALTFQNWASWGLQTNISEAFLNRRYALDLVKIEPQLSGLLQKNWRISGIYKYKKGINVYKPNGEQTINHDFSIESTWNKSTQSQLRAKLGLVQVRYEGARNTPVEFALLEGLQNGRNYIWNVQIDKTLAKNVLLSLSYDGRKTGSLNPIHVGRAQVRANF